MDKNFPIIVFRLEGQRHGLKLSVVERVLRVVEVISVAHAPKRLRGLINVGGKIIPVIDIRQVFQLPARRIELSDQLILARTQRYDIAMIVDEVDGVWHCAATDVINAQAILPGVGTVDSILRLSDGLLLIQDIDRLLSLGEERLLPETLDAGGINAGSLYQRTDSIIPPREPTS